MLSQHQCLFEPISIGSCRIKNRFAMSPMGTFGMTDENGVMTDACIDYYVTRAKGGVGLIITGMCIVEDRFEKNDPCGVPLFSSSVNHQILKRQMQRLTDRVHAYNSKIFLQLSAGFGRASHIGSFCHGAVAPSEIKNRFDPSVLHRALTKEEIQCYIESFAREAAFAKSYGFDGVEIHALHEGYLLDQFATEVFNQRTDEYGGSFENRYRFAVEILQAIKDSCGKSFPVIMRYSPKHCMKGIAEGGLPGEAYTEMGRDMPEGLTAASYLEKMGYDALDVDLGCYDAHFWSHPPVYFKDGMYLDAASAVKKVVSIPILVSGRMDDPDKGADAVAKGKCDMLALGRPLLADPELPNKVSMGATDQIRPCISCNYGCSVRIRTEGTIGCAVNAACAQESRRRLFPAMVKKRILVVGGGPAGMEFARVSALRGHTVRLIEKKPYLGGQLIPAGQAPFKHHDLQLAKWFASQLQSLCVDVLLSTEAKIKDILDWKPDHVIVAAGATPRRISVPGSELPHVFTLMELSMEIDKAGQNVVIIGAGQAGVELGLWLASMGRKVSILNRSDAIMKGAYHNTATMAKQMIKRDGINLFVNVGILAIREKDVLIQKDGKEFSIPADTVVNAVGSSPEQGLYGSLSSIFPTAYLIGDAQSPHNVYTAVHNAYEISSII